MAFNIIENNDVDPRGFLKFLVYGRTSVPIINDIITAEKDSILIANSINIPRLTTVKCKKISYDKFADLGDIIEMFESGKISAKLIILHDISSLYETADSHVKLMTRSEAVDGDIIKSSNYAELEAMINLTLDILRDFEAVTNIFIVLADEQSRLSTTTSDVTHIGPFIKNDYVKSKVESIFPEVFRCAVVLDKGLKTITYKTEGVTVEARDESQSLNEIEPSFGDILKKIRSLR